jgi:hypothetical protein
VRDPVTEVVLLYIGILYKLHYVFFSLTMLLRLGYVLFLPKSSCVWPMLAADTLWRVVCSFI